MSTRSTRSPGLPAEHPNVAPSTWLSPSLPPEPGSPEAPTKQCIRISADGKGKGALPAATSLPRGQQQPLGLRPSLLTAALRQPPAISLLAHRKHEHTPLCPKYPPGIQLCGTPAPAGDPGGERRRFKLRIEVDSKKHHSISSASLCQGRTTAGTRDHQGWGSSTSQPQGHQNWVLVAAAPPDSSGTVHTAHLTPAAHSTFLQNPSIQHPLPPHW